MKFAALTLAIAAYLMAQPASAQEYMSDADVNAMYAQMLSPSVKTCLDSGPGPNLKASAYIETCSVARTKIQERRDFVAKGAAAKGVHDLVLALIIQQENQAESRRAFHATGFDLCNNIGSIWYLLTHIDQNSLGPKTIASINRMIADYRPLVEKCQG